MKPDIGKFESHFPSEIMKIFGWIGLLAGMILAYFVWIELGESRIFKLVSLAIFLESLLIWALYLSIADSAKNILTIKYKVSNIDDLLDKLTVIESNTKHLETISSRLLNIFMSIEKYVEKKYPTPLVPPVKKSNFWTCKVCLHDQNPKSKNVCENCESPRGATES